VLRGALDVGRWKAKLTRAVDHAAAIVGPATAHKGKFGRRPLDHRKETQSPPIEMVASGLLLQFRQRYRPGNSTKIFGSPDQGDKP
jgi:hypothetical protein